MSAFTSLYVLEGYDSITSPSCIPKVFSHIIYRDESVHVRCVLLSQYWSFFIHLKVKCQIVDENKKIVDVQYTYLLRLLGKLRRAIRVRALCKLKKIKIPYIQVSP